MGEIDGVTVGVLVGVRVGVMVIVGVIVGGSIVPFTINAPGTLITGSLTFENMLLTNEIFTAVVPVGL